MTKEIFILLNLALAFYNVGTIWAHEIDIFRSWRLLESATFRAAQEIHWRKLPYWVFGPVGLSLMGSVALFWYHPGQIQPWEIWLAFGIQVLSHALTALFWGQWQAKLSHDVRGGASPYLAKILRTHWVRTALINAYGFMLLYMTIQTTN